MALFHKLLIQDIQKETHNAVTISFHIPNTLKDQYQFKAGQYVTLKTTIDNIEVRRDYSICTSPSSKTLKVGIKEITDGFFSHHANHNLKTGDSLEVSCPKGRFTFDNNSDAKNILLFAAGSGITPITVSYTHLTLPTIA